MEAIILAGGFGTRLAHILKDVPKPMAPIGRHPFLYYLMADLVDKGIKKIVLAVGYKKEYIINYFGESFRGVPIQYSVEDTPLFTGGAIKKAIPVCEEEEDLLIVNGDTFFDIDINDIYIFHKKMKSKFTIATKYMENYDRYGTIQQDHNNKIMGFIEKKRMEKGYINGGIYLINRHILDNISLSKFSFEKDFMEKDFKNIGIYSFPCNAYFMDIGVEEDYNKFQNADILKKNIFRKRKGAFFDRDGTINVEKNYLYRIEDFEFRPGMPEMIKRYKDDGYVIIVITNQAGIARGYYTEKDMHILHDYINQELSKIGTRIDAFYFCPHHPDFTGPCHCRKPDTGMIEKAIKDWDIDVQESILFGDKPWDIEAGERVGIKSCVIK